MLAVLFQGSTEVETEILNRADSNTTAVWRKGLNKEDMMMVGT